MSLADCFLDRIGEMVVLSGLGLSALVMMCVLALKEDRDEEEGGA